MTYLTGKRFELLSDGKKGVIVSEPFQKAKCFDHEETPTAFYTAVAVLWEDGTMSGVVDVETLKVEEENPDGYVVAATWPQDADGELVMETYTGKSSLKEAQKRASCGQFKDKKPRIAELKF